MKIAVYGEGFVVRQHGKSSWGGPPMRLEVRQVIDEFRSALQVGDR